jgi:hypothetical protein
MLNTLKWRDNDILINRFSIRCHFSKKVSKKIQILKLIDPTQYNHLFLDKKDILSCIFNQIFALCELNFSLIEQKKLEFVLN